MTKNVTISSANSAFRLVYSLLLISTSMSLEASGQGTITGPISSAALTTQNYSLTDDVIYSNPAWAVTNGTIVSQSKSGLTYYVSVKWDCPPSGTLAFKNGAYTVDQITVTLSCPSVPTPNATFTYNTQCRTTVITRSNPIKLFNATWFWQNLSNGESTSNSTATFNATSSGTYYLRTRNNTCTTCWGAAQATSQVTVINPAAPSATPGSRCGSGSVTLNATAGTQGDMVRWYDASANGNLLYTGTSFATPGISSTTTYYAATYNSTYICESTSRTSVTATINPIPSAPAAVNNSRCGAGSVNLSATAGANSNTVRWYSASTGGTPLATALSYTTPSLTSTTTYYISSFNSTTGCESTSSAIAVTATINAVPAAPIGTGNSRCGEGSVTLSATAGIDGNTVLWYSASTGGSPLVTALSYTTPSLTSTTTYYISSFNSTTGCESTSARVPVTATINPIPYAPAGTGNSRCGTGTVTLNAAAGINGNTVRWYSASTGGSPLVTALSYTTPSLASTTTYYISSFNSTTGCESTGSRVAVPATINSIPSEPGVSGNSRIGTGTLTLTGSGTPEGGIYNWYNASGALLATGTTYTTPSVSSSELNYLYLKAISGAGCEGGPTWVNITIYPIPTIILEGSSAISPGGKTQLSASSEYYSYQWYRNGSVLAGITLRTITVAKPGTYQVHVRSSSTDSPYPSNDLTISDAIATQNLNYIIETEFLKEGVLKETDIYDLQLRDFSERVQYFDGLGRPVQTVQVKAAPEPNFADIIIPIAYDQFGRQTKEYLPYTVAAEGRYQSDAVPTAQLAFYDPATVYKNKIKTDAAPYAQTVFEDSPLNRVLQKGAPGSAWQPDAVTPANGKTIKSEYLVNVDGTALGQEKIKIWTLTSVILNTLPEFVVSTSSYYPSNTLFVDVTKDEENRQVRTYTDKQGKVVLKKVQYVNTPAINNDNDWTLTYYIYDEFDRLRFVLQPKFVARNSIYDGYALDNQSKKNMLDSLSFEYRYDERSRMIYKRVPGAGKVEMVYDEWDRLVLSQDANQRTATKWSFIKYDWHNRPVITGEFASSNTRDQMVTAVKSIANRYENIASGNSVGYTLNLTYPATVTISDIYAITYYDDYTFKTNLGLGTAYDASIPAGFTGQVYNRVKNLVTGAKTRVLESSPAQWLITATYYDDRYRLLQIIGDDHRGNKNRTTNESYGITPWITKSQSSHGSSLTMLTETEYDHRGRVMKVWQTMDVTPRVLVVANRYNDLGQLIEKNVHSTDNGATFLQSNDYRYNIRGWLTHINNSALTNDGTINDDANDLFGMELKYNEAVSVNGINTAAQFNGNISAIQWKTNNLKDVQDEKVYGFSYDNLNRLTDARYATKNGSSWIGNANLFNEEGIRYDKNGNISAMNRTAPINGVNSAIDQLVYKYEGNRLTNVHDNSLYYDGNNANPDFGFKEIAHNTGLIEYAYDVNGSMTSDMNKSITSIQYNHLNLPKLVTLSGNRTIEYTYDAAGVKLRKIASTGGTVISQTDYVGGIQYEGTTRVLKFVATPEGRVVKKGSTWDYEYFHKDHLGNTRVVYGYMKQVDEYKATMETALASQEEAAFKNVAATRVIAYNHTPASGQFTVPDKSAETNGNLSGKAIGPAKMLQVSAGDSLHLEVFARYSTGTGANNTLITTLASAVTGTFGLGAGEAAYNAINNNVPARAATFSSDPGVPKAYLFYILFDNNYVYQQFGYKVVTPAAMAGHECLNLGFTIPASGYLYTYVANESNVSSATSVYFDDFNIIHTRAASALQVIQTMDYYPFGLTFNSYQRENSVPNQTLYNSMELQDELNLGWYDYIARQYDPALGRFLSIDPLADVSRRWSPYVYAYNNPVRFIDPDGMLPEDSNKPKEYENDHRYITVTYSGGPMSESTNTVTETHTTSSGKIETDDDGNETFVERSTSTTTTQVINADGETVSQSQAVTNSEKRTEVKDATQAHLFGPDEKIKVKGKELSNVTTTTTSDKFNPSDKFKSIASLTAGYVRLNPGSSINHATTDYFSSMSKNPLAAEDMKSGAMNTGMGLVSFALEGKKQLYYDQYNGGVYVDKSRAKTKTIWRMGK